MKLREVLKNVNEVFQENMRKEVIRTSEFKHEYDEVEGRKIINEYNVQKIINKFVGISMFMTINKSVNLEFLGMKFKLKRKKSGLKSDGNYTEKLTYVSIEIDENYSDKLDIEMEDLLVQYEDSKKQKRESEKNENITNVNNFKNLLSDCGLTVDKFKELSSKFDMLTWSEKDMLLK